MRRPVHCRVRAYEALACHMPVIETREGLLGGAVALAMHELPAADADSIAAEIETYTRDIRRRLRGDHPDAILAHAHALLFEDAGFGGGFDDPTEYYDPLNSYLPHVLIKRRGLPITLTLLYKLVVEPLGLPVHGVNTPGHFVAEVELPGTLRAPMLVDPFERGRVLTRQELMVKVRQTAPQATPMLPDLSHTLPALPRATHRQWLARMIHNLMHVFQQRGRTADFAAMREMLGLLNLGG